MRIPSFVRALLAVAAALFIAVPAHAQAVSGQGTWETTLLGRDINLNAVAATDASAVYLYDTTLNVTWLRDANLNGGRSWSAGTDWAANLVTGSGAKAISDWRLPTMTDPAVGCNFSFSGTNCGFNVAASSSELASLFYSTLGNKSNLDASGNPQSDYGLTNVGSFQNMQSYTYFSGTQGPPFSDTAWGFDTGFGTQSPTGTNCSCYVMAVHDGDVLAPVPEPETSAMLLAGLGLIGAVTRRHRSNKALSTKS